MTRFLLASDSCGFVDMGALSDERMGLLFPTAAGPSQRIHSRIRAPWDSQPYSTVSDLRLPFSLPPTTRRVMVEVFDPASARVKTSLTAIHSHGNKCHLNLNYFKFK
jgi:hypothetical protein